MRPDELGEYRAIEIDRTTYSINESNPTIIQRERTDTHIMRNIKNLVMAGFKASSTVTAPPPRRSKKAPQAAAAATTVAEDVYGFDYQADEVEADATPVRAPAATEAPAPKKRGRPRKHPLPPVPVAAAEVAAPKKRGRPRKVPDISPGAVMPKPAPVAPTPPVMAPAPREKKAPSAAKAKKALAALTPKAVEGEVPPTDIERKRQLRCLVREYQALTDQIRATKQRTGPYTMRETGEVRQSPLNQEQKDALLRNAAAQETQRAGVLRQIEKILVHFPLYAQFIEKVPGVGVACAGLLLANIDWTRCEKVSSLQQFCGMGVRVDEEGKGHAQRKQAGTALDYRQEIKTALWHCFAQSMVKAKDGRRVVASVEEDGTKVYATDEEGNEIRTGNEAVQNSPYFRRMVEYKHRLLSSPRYNEADNTFDGRKGGKAIINNMAYRPAAQLFLEHLYILGRTMAGLGVWPSYEAVKLGYGHGGKVAVNAPKFLTLPEAFAAVGVPMPAAVA